MDTTEVRNHWDTKVLVRYTMGHVDTTTRRRRSKAKERPVETEYAVTETNRVYEDIREDGQRRSPPVEISSGYSSAKYSKPSAAETNDDYSVITAANLQNTAEEDSGRLTYSEVHFTNRPPALAHQAPSGGEALIMLLLCSSG
ncbi:hypothetical protein PFLUV_G00278660 [Perca fluviatilis]|uniref:Uncharacterized protein n=1 Tax=Perca fluviatilis TaxID=8168 RepID=A0A6A5DT50_PERFL|nr:hypothetical protein PFLUV_G00278660 [Perca fluviatilis]